jgi:ABC-type dipeptide/oligopeptide/nickel transport system permease subunit
MIADGRQFLMTAVWIIMSPGVALMLTVLAFNFIGDGLRDVFDPKMKT